LRAALGSDRFFELLLSVVARFDNRPGKTLFVCRPQGATMIAWIAAPRVHGRHLFERWPMRDIPFMALVMARLTMPTGSASAWGCG